MSIDKEVLFLIEYFNVLKSSNSDIKKSTNKFKIEVVKLLNSKSIEFKTVEVINNIYGFNIETELEAELNSGKKSMFLKDNSPLKSLFRKISVGDLTSTHSSDTVEHSNGRC